jgi:hypothetical protein
MVQVLGGPMEKTVKAASEARSDDSDSDDDDMMKVTQVR